MLQIHMNLIFDSVNLQFYTKIFLSVPGASMTVAPTTPDGPIRNDFDTISVESCGLSPIALQNIREQMALSLERTKQLEDQVKQVPELKVSKSKHLHTSKLNRVVLERDLLFPDFQGFIKSHD